MLAAPKRAGFRRVPDQCEAAGSNPANEAQRLTGRLLSRPGGFGCASRRRVPSWLCSPGGVKRHDGDVHALTRTCQSTTCAFAMHRFDRQTDTWSIRRDGGSGGSPSLVATGRNDHALAIWDGEALRVEAPGDVAEPRERQDRIAAPRVPVAAHPRNTQASTMASRCTDFVAADPFLDAIKTVN
jgi:hypothetical protein